MRILDYKLDQKKSTVSMTVKLTSKELSTWSIRKIDSAIKAQAAVVNSIESEKIIKAVFEALDIPFSMFEKLSVAHEVGRFAKMVELRRACIYSLRVYGKMTYMGIADIFGLHHASAIHHSKRYMELLEMNDERTMYIDDEVMRLLNQEVLKKC